MCMYDIKCLKQKAYSFRKRTNESQNIFCTREGFLKAILLMDHMRMFADFQLEFSKKLKLLRLIKEVFFRYMNCKYPIE